MTSTVTLNGRYHEDKRTRHMGWNLNLNRIRNLHIALFISALRHLQHIIKWKSIFKKRKKGKIFEIFTNSYHNIWSSWNKQQHCKLLQQPSIPIHASNLKRISSSTLLISLYLRQMSLAVKGTRRKSKCEKKFKWLKNNR